MLSPPSAATVCSTAARHASGSRTSVRMTWQRRPFGSPFASTIWRVVLASPSFSLYTIATSAPPSRMQSRWRVRYRSLRRSDNVYRALRMLTLIKWCARPSRNDHHDDHNHIARLIRSEQDVCPQWTAPTTGRPPNGIRRAFAYAPPWARRWKFLAGGRPARYIPKRTSTPPTISIVVTRSFVKRTARIATRIG